MRTSAFDDANHELVVIGTACEGFYLWCRRCDRASDRAYDNLAVAQGEISAAQKDIAPRCAEKLRRDVESR